MRNTLIKLFVLVLATVALAGCTHDMSDLHHFVDNVKSRHVPPPPPIPALPPYQSYTYHDEGMRSPFQPPTLKKSNSKVRPDTHRNKEYLEKFPLDSLSMVGTIKINGIEYALIEDNNGLVHKVHRGNYMGQNDGRIIAINTTNLMLREIVPNGLGGYVKRKTKVTLVTAGSK